MSDTDPVHARLFHQIKGLAGGHRRAVLRSLMPAIDTALTQGVPYAEITRQLGASGIELTAESLRKARYRWRKRGARTIEDRRTGAADLMAAGPLTPSPKAIQAERITSKADLVRLRKSQDHIDLDELADLGRQK